MNLSAPKQIVFIISLVLTILAVIGVWVVAIPFISANAFIVLLVGWIVLAAGNLMAGM